MAQHAPDPTPQASPGGSFQGAAPGEVRVCVGAVAGAQGVRGALRIKPFTADPAGVAAYGPVSDEAGTRHFTLTVREVRKGVVVATAPEVRDRDAAEALRGLRLYVPRTALPEPEAEEFYHADLIGLAAVGSDGTVLGTVRALYDFGAGEVMEIVASAGGRPFAIPFTREAVPEIDLAGRRVVVIPPPGLVDGLLHGVLPDEADGPSEERAQDGEGAR